MSGRTINAELGELSRAIGKRWKVLWPKVRKLDERTDVGRALSPEEEQRLLAALPQCRSEIMPFYVKIALLTAMRSGEILSLKWGQLDFLNRMIPVGRAKTSSGTGRQIPINDELHAILTAHAQWFTERFGSISAHLYLFPFGKTPM